jgi:formamidopyrimidine-DNA glycosylase
MPELPEVECLTRAVRHSVLGHQLSSVTFYRRDLRTPIPTKAIEGLSKGASLNDVCRRSKYMIWDVAEGRIIFHLGMSGNMLMFDTAEPQRPHTHAVFGFRDSGDGATYLHFIDPRRFGRIEYCAANQRIDEHALLKHLGPEPLEHQQLGKHLFDLSRGKTQPVKTMIMDAKNVVGVGNIYASESLFRARINPLQAAGSIGLSRYETLASAIVDTLSEAILSGGTSFKDFCHPNEEDQGFELRLAVYGREGELCDQCGSTVQQKRLSGRATFYCPKCQPRKPKKL